MKKVTAEATVGSVFVALTIALCTSMTCHAQPNDDAARTTPAMSDKAFSAKAIEAAKEGKLDNAINFSDNIVDSDLKTTTMGLIGEQDARKFWSTWGVGLVVNFDTGHRKPIKSANIINGIVRIEEEDNIKYGLGLEVHRFVWGTTWGATSHRPWSGAIALGPYASVMPGTNEVIDVIGAGIVCGIIGGRSSEAQDNKLSMNIAGGWYVDPGTRVLADTFEDGKPPPAGETTVRYKTMTQYGAQAVLSFSYNF